LRDPGAVEGVVFEEGVPLGEASVYVHYEAERELPYTYAAVAEDGRYRITGLAPGRVEVRAHHGGQFSRSIKREGIVHSGQATQVDLEFRSGTSALAGRVTVNGTPPEIAVLYLSIETEAGQDGSQARAESDGSYEFLGLPPGRAELIVHVAKAADTVDPQRHTFDIEIPEGARIEKNIELSE